MGRSRRRFDFVDNPRRSDRSPHHREKPPSQETGGVSACYARKPGAAGQPSAPAREGEEDTMRLHGLLARVAGIFFAFFCVTPSQAQTTATIAGTLTDPSGAAISSAEIAAQ